MVKNDEWGPEKIVEVYDPKTGMHGFTVIDSTVLGPAKGGIRMTPTLDKEEVFRLARAMTWKCSLAELPFGGGKSGIIANAKELGDKKKDMVAAFAKSLKNLAPSEYVAAPDISMAEPEMRIFADTIGNKKACTGKPADMGGLPHELGSTGYGVVQAALVAIEFSGKKPQDITFAVEGFGNVGTFAVKFLTEAGATCVATSDSKGVIYKKEGLDYDELMKIKKETRTVTNYGGGEKLPNEKIIEIECDMLIPAAIPDLLTMDNMDRVKAQYVVCGSNIAMTNEVEEAFHKKGVLVVPDFVANAGGVISSYVEYIGGTAQDMWKMIKEKITTNTLDVLERSKEKAVKPRDAALEIAKERITAKRGFK